MGRKYIEPIMVMLMLGIMLTIMIDFAFISTQVSTIQIELLVILTVLCIAGLWYAGYEYESLRTYRDQYSILKILIPALDAEQVVAVVTAEYLAAKNATEQLQLMRTQRRTPNAPSLRQLRAQERETSHIRIKYINLCRLVTQHGIHFPDTLVLGDPWQWKHLMQTSLPE